LSRASERILSSVTAWAQTIAPRAGVYRRMQIWQGLEPDSASTLHFDGADAGEPDLGHIVEDAVIRAALTDRLSAAPNARLTHRAVVDSVSVGSGGAEVVLSGGGRRRADLLIAADGGASTIRQQLEMPVLGHDYRQAALVAHVRTERPHAQTARQRFLPGGPLALLPLFDGRSSIVWSMPVEQAREYLALDDEDFLGRLTDASCGVLGRLGPISARAEFPLRMLHARRYCRPGVVLVGDAAHCVHPLAGQGMNLGLLDAAVLADEISRACLNGWMPGSLRPLRRYERRRKGDNLSMMLALDALDRLFRAPQPLSPLRATGMRVVESVPAAKRLLVRRALGLDRRMPAALGTPAA
jgi:2-octaprenylphenol hydroxylase